MVRIGKDIVELAKRARDGKLVMDDLTGGTFTITNGGVFGSLVSTPIINFPQAGILGLHKIQDLALKPGLDRQHPQLLALRLNALFDMSRCIDDLRRIEDSGAIGDDGPVGDQHGVR
jgi:hypothetical protein